MRAQHDMPFGARLRAEGGADFRLWGPAAREAEVAVYNSYVAAPRFVPAACDARGWWECHVPEAMAGTLYHWRINGELLVPDPASRQNPHGVHEPSCIVDPAQFEWDNDWVGRPWAQAVVYEMHVGAFTPEGTFAAASGQLASLAKLGITAIELMPVSAFPGRFGWGYDGVLHFAPHAPYGTPDELKHFIQQAHRLGMMVFLDVVYNHFGPAGNYLGTYAPQFFSETRSSPWGAAIDFEGPGSRAVRDFFIHNALYWLIEYRFDGLRLDAVHAIGDESKPHFLEELSSAVRAATAARHVHLVLENETNEYARLGVEPAAGRFDGQWNDDFHHALHTALTGEAHTYYHDYGEAPLNLLARSLTHGMLFEGSPRHPGGARKLVREAPPQPLGTMVNFACNHDQAGNRALGERLNMLAPPGAGELALLLALLTPAIPMLFFGEEFGATTPFLYFADWQGDLREAVRQGREREFGHAARAAGRELPDACSMATFEASRLDETQRASAEGMRWLDMVQRALAMRKAHLAPRHALLTTRGHVAERVGDTGIRVIWRYDDGQCVLLEFNLGPQPVTAQGQMVQLSDVRELLSHGRPDGTADDTWPGWSARWSMGRQA